MPSAELPVSAAALEPVFQTIPPPLRIWTKLQRVMQAAEFIRKDKRNDFHNYSYASEAAIKECLHPLLAAEGLLFVPRSQEIISFEPVGTPPGEGNGKAQMRLLTLRLMYWWVDAETGEHLECTCLGMGMDNGDKAVYKSITGAVKYALTSTFLIPTSEGDSEAHTGGRNEPPPPRRTEQRTERRQLPPPAPASIKTTAPPVSNPTPALPANHPQTIARRTTMEDFKRLFGAAGVPSSFDTILETFGLKGTKLGEWTEGSYTACCMKMRAALQVLGQHPAATPTTAAAAPVATPAVVLTPGSFTAEELEEMVINFRTARGPLFNRAQLDKLIYSYTGTREDLLILASEEAVAKAKAPPPPNSTPSNGRRGK